MSASIPSAKEVAAARAFLRVLGVSSEDVDLIAAVIAWMRTEGGPANNPLNARSADGRRLAIGTVKRHGVHYNVYRNMTDALRAAAYQLLAAGHRKGFDIVVASFRRAPVAEVLTALALSGWNDKHYGWTIDDQSKNAIVNEYKRIKRIVIPPKPQPKVYYTKAPQPQKTLQPIAPDKPYTDPYAAAKFYRDRHPRGGTLI